VVLLCGAALFVRSLSNVRALDVGYDAARLITASVSYDDRSANDDPTLSSRLAGLQSRTATIPGVRHVALSGERPMYSISWLTFFTATDSSRRDFSPTFTAVSPGYFVAAGLRMLRGEDFGAGSDAAAPPSIVVNDAMAKLAWPGRSAIGECVRFGARTHPCYRVIGVVETARERTLIEDPKPKYYLPLANLPPEAKNWRAHYLVVNADPARAVAVTSELRTLIRQQFPGGIPRIVRLSDYLEPQYRPWRLGAALFLAFGALAFVVAAIGIYSSVAYSVNQRLHEFGVRIALGARLVDVVGLVVGGGLRVVALGVVAGVVLSLATGKFVATLLYGVSPSSPAVLASVVVVLLAAGLVAALIPAWRAGRVDPVVALRAD
jgi:putative ABC transport system permease protein